MQMLITEQELSVYTAKQAVELQCTVCGSAFHRAKNVVLMARNGQRAGKRGGRTLNTCGRACTGILQRRQPNATCTTCTKPLCKPTSELTASGNNFCSRSCSATHYNRNKTSGVRRSKGEVMLIELLKQKHPKLNIEANVRSLLASGCEIDILIASQRVAIELNGPLHYEAIFGQAKLEKTQAYDRLKKAELQALGFDFVVLNITEASRRNRLLPFLTAAYDEQIKHLLTD